MRTGKEKYSRIFTFWKFELPLIFPQTSPCLPLHGCHFILFVTIGYLSSAYNPEFVRGVLGMIMWI